MSVNIGTEREITQGSRQLVTGIFKTPVSGAIQVHKLGVEQDTVCDSRFHGGVDQAVYIYRQEDYTWWANELRREMPPGLFGENLTIKGIPGPGLFVGDVLAFPDLTLQVTAPRIPCATLAEIMGDPKFLRRYLEAKRPGFYCRVLKEGTIAQGQEGRLETIDTPSISTTTFFEDVRRKLTSAEIKSYLGLLIDERSRADFETKLRKLKAEGSASE